MSFCTKHSPFRGTVRVTDKGQITIPKYLQDELGIKRGDHLLILKRDDGQGFNVIKSDIIENILSTKRS